MPHHFCFKALIYNDLYIENTRKLGCFFVSDSLFGEFGERQITIKPPKFSVLPFPGTPRLRSNIPKRCVLRSKKNKSPRIFAQIKTNRPFICKNKPKTPNLASIRVKTVKDNKTNLTMRLLYVILPKQGISFNITYKNVLWNKK